jgi:hypothetical protein
MTEAHTAPPPEPTLLRLIGAVVAGLAAGTALGFVFSSLVSPAILLAEGRTTTEAARLLAVAGFGFSIVSGLVSAWIARIVGGGTLTPVWWLLGISLALQLANIFALALRFGFEVSFLLSMGFSTVLSAVFFALGAGLSLVLPPRRRRLEAGAFD